MVFPLSSLLSPFSSLLSPLTFPHSPHSHSPAIEAAYQRVTDLQGCLCMCVCVSLSVCVCLSPSLYVCLSLFLYVCFSLSLCMYVCVQCVCVCTLCMCEVCLSVCVFSGYDYASKPYAFFLRVKVLNNKPSTLNRVVERKRALELEDWRAKPAGLKMTVNNLVTTQYVSTHLYTRV